MNTGRFRPTPIPRERRRRRCARFLLTDAQGREIAVMVRDISSRGLSAAALREPPALDQVVRARLEDSSEVWGLALARRAPFRRRVRHPPVVAGL